MKLIKIDTIHPKQYLQKILSTWQDEVGSLKYKEYHDRLIKLRVNNSDFYTHNLKELGWDASEYFLNDEVYEQKVASELYGPLCSAFKLKNRLFNRSNQWRRSWKLQIYHDLIELEKPDVLFIREHSGLPSNFWRQFKNNCLLVSQISALMPRDWSPLDYDAIYTDIPTYRDFFQSNNIKVFTNLNGFDRRVLNEVSDEGKVCDISFVGGLKSRSFSKRLSLMKAVASDDSFSFRWWGYRDNDLEEPLLGKWGGIIGGLEMYQAYKNSKIVLNDYIDVAGGVGVNMRIFEAVGIGSFLLTRMADNLYDIFPKDVIATFVDERDCIDKIKYYLGNEREREEMAKEAQRIVLETRSYAKIMDKLSSELKSAHARKFQNG
ncbi:MAG: hypothetical protein DHS20C01_13990 [marine bacterium B5-7]|nr:MAG: hypothetical protein DHS20C01_13990 [marine bacterium B5-7]